MVLKQAVLCVALLALATWTEGNSRCGDRMVCVDSFTYTVTNHVIWPYFNNSISLKIVPDKPVIHYMQEACTKDPQEFSGYTATYYYQYGYFIEAINGLQANWKDNRTYWDFSNATESLSVGVSYYMPSPGDQVLLKFTVDSNKQRKGTIDKRITNGRLH